MATLATGTQIETKGLSLDEWMARFDEQPIEVVEGEVIIMTPAKRQHARLADELFYRIRGYLDQHPLGQAFSDGVPYVLDGDPRADWVRGSRVPDVSFITAARIAAHDDAHPEDGPWFLAPDLAVEIISESEKPSDVIQKVRDYLRFGVRLVWLVDRSQRLVHVYTQDDPVGIVLTAADTLTGGEVLPGWEAPVSDLFPASP